MNCSIELNRRNFLKGGAAAIGGLVISFHLPGNARRHPQAMAQSTADPFVPNAFLRIGTDDTVTVLANHSEMGQGVYTSLPMLVAEELDADWSKIRVEAAPVDPVYNNLAFGSQGTGGSTSVRTNWERLRNAGATARAMLVAAAADTWGVDPASCHTENGFVIHEESGQQLSYGQLAEAASGLTPPANVTLKEPQDFKIIGTRTKRLDTPEKVDGTGVFGLDVQLENMLVAVVARPPVFGGTVKSFNPDKSLALPGVHHVVEIYRGIAVVADGYWPALQGRKALEVEWDEGPLSDLNSLTQGEQLAELANEPGAVALNEGDVTAGMNQATTKLEAEYRFPYLAHAPMEPLNCVADVRADGCDIWTGTQGQTTERFTAAFLTGLDPEQVNVHTQLLGGGFGRRGTLDGHFVAEAVQISQSIQAPVKVIWSREDDIQGGYYRPTSYHSISAGLDTAGDPISWQHRIVSQSIMEGTDWAAPPGSVEDIAVEGAAELPYAIPSRMVDWQRAPRGVPLLWWRSVGHSHNAFVVETFVDELAHAADRDPYEFRQALLTEHPRHQRVLEAVADMAGWGNPPPEGQGRGLAVHESFGSFVAQVADVSVSAEGKVKVHRVFCAVDCGPIVNPDTIEAQIEGGIAFGLTAALYGEITFNNGRVEQNNFHDYKMLRIDEMPQVETSILSSTDSMGGVGEISVPPIAPAVANAIFTVTGKRVRQLPIQSEDLRGATS